MFGKKEVSKCSEKPDFLTGVRWEKPIVFSKFISFNFCAVYETEVSFEPLTDAFQLITVTGTADDAPFGLTEFQSNNYSTFPDENGEFQFSGDPADFGIEGEVFGDEFSGKGRNKLFGTSSGTGEIDFEEGIVSGAGTIDVTGGRGILRNASGTLTFEETETLADGMGTATVSGTIAIPVPPLFGG